MRLSRETCEEMGLESKWLDSDYPTWMAVFAEEISEMTPYRITAYPLSGSHWKGADVCLHCRIKPAVDVGEPPSILSHRGKDR